MVVAAVYGPILASRFARRASQPLLATDPFIGVRLHALIPGKEHAALLRTVPAVVRVLAGPIAVSATGTIAPRLLEIPRRPQHATFICAIAIAVDLTVLELAATQLVTPSGAYHWPPTMVAAAASLGRPGYMKRATRYRLCARLMWPIHRIPATICSSSESSRGPSFGHPWGRFRSGRT